GEPPVEIRAPFEVPFLEARGELAPENVRSVQVDVLLLPARPVRGPDRLPAGGGERTVLRLVPVAGRLVHLLPRELVEDQDRSESCERVERRTERLDVVQHTLSDDRVEVPLAELLEPHAVEASACGRTRIDTDGVVPRRGERGRDPTLRPAADLEHVRRRRRQLREYECREVHHREPRTGAPDRSACTATGR